MVYVQVKQHVVATHSTLAILDMKDRVMGDVLIRIPLVPIIKYFTEITHLAPANRVLLGRYVMGWIHLTAIRQLVTYLAPRTPPSASESIVAGLDAIPEI